MSQPDWKYICNLGDRNPIDHGGAFLYVDATGVYTPEVAYLVAPDEDPEDPRKAAWTVYRFIIEPCTFIDGILSDNKFHPTNPAWFAGTEAERSERPQDTTYLKNIARSISEDVDTFAQHFLSTDVRERAFAWLEVGHYHGFENLDTYPTHLTREEATMRYAQEMVADIERYARRDKTFQKVWARHPRGGKVEGYASELCAGLYSPERKIAPTIEAAAQGLGMSFPDSQVNLL